MSKPATDWADPGKDIDAISPLTAEEFAQIRQLAHESFGLDLKSGKEEMVAARLRRLLRGGGFHSYREYHRHVLADSTGEALACMIDALATNHTAFLRESSHFDFFREKVVPSLSNREPVEIWCGACSTGEEVWTLAFLLNDRRPTGGIHIVASDISNKALRAAHRAEYTAERCVGLPPGWMGRYLVPEGKPARLYRVLPEIRRQVSFYRANLLEPAHWHTRFPVIFCRNVMIYFDAATQERVVAQLSDCLEPGGYLFVGQAESLTRIHHKLEYVRPAIYRKPGKRGS